VAVQCDAAGVRRAKTGDGFDQLRLAITLHAGNANDRARPDFQVEIVDGGVATVILYSETFEAEHDLARRGRALRSSCPELTPDHQPSKLLLVCLRGRHSTRDASPTHDGDPIADRHDFLELVRDK